MCKVYLKIVNLNRYAIPIGLAITVESEMTKNREYSVCDPESVADACVIWLHGLGADGSDFMGIVDQLGLPNNHGVRFIFPNAPFIPITINQGMVMRGWYDIYDLGSLHKEDAKGIENSAELVTEIIQQQLDQGIASTRIILAGFSQGGAIALFTGLRFAQPLGGILVLSSYFLLATQFKALDYPQNQQTPIFIAHGMFDPVVPFDAGKSAYELLHNANYTVDWHTYPMQHTVAIEEIADIGRFIRGCLGYA